MRPKLTTTIITALLLMASVSVLVAQDTATQAHAEYVLREVVNCYKHDSINRYLRMLYTIDDEVKLTSTPQLNKADSVKNSPRWREHYLEGRRTEQRSNVSSYQEIELMGILNGLNWRSVACLGVKLSPPSDSYKARQHNRVSYAAEIMLRDDQTNQLYALNLTASFIGRKLDALQGAYFDKFAQPEDHMEVGSLDAAYIDVRSESVVEEPIVPIRTYKAAYRNDTVLLIIRHGKGQRIQHSYSLLSQPGEIALTPEMYSRYDQYNDPNGNTWCLYHLDDNIYVYILGADGTVTDKLLFKP